MINIYNRKIVTDGDMSSSIESPSVDLSKTNGYSVYAKWTGSPVGTIHLKVSLDGENFVVMPSSSTEINGAGDALWEISTAFYDQLKVEYVATSGTGTLNVQVNGKGDIY